MKFTGLTALNIALKKLNGLEEPIGKIKCFGSLKLIFRFAKECKPVNWMLSGGVKLF